jgi:GT2 family glycosyltransferase
VTGPDIPIAMPAPDAPIDVSICMVSLNCWNVIEPCLRSLRASTGGVTYEVIVVDNASTDRTPELLAQHFPEVQVVRNQRNVGFTIATNQGIRASRGRYILWLNTDTVLQPDSLARLVAFLDDHPAAGVVGPKVLNGDGSFQPQCRRGLPTPLVALLYMGGAERLLPGRTPATQYLLSHLPVDQSNQVTSVSGCCLLARRAVWDQIGPLDESIFGFGEDIDWCVRAHDAGWEVWYYPGSVITHLKGQGGVHSKPYHKAWGIHQAMWVFYRKHLHRRYGWPMTAAVAAGVLGSLAATVSGLWVRRRIRALVSWRA